MPQVLTQAAVKRRQLHQGDALGERPISSRLRSVASVKPAALATPPLARRKHTSVHSTTSDAIAVGNASGQGVQPAALSGAAKPVRGNIDMGEGVRVIVAPPRKANVKTIHALWVFCYDAPLEGMNACRSRHKFVLCDDASFQPRQPREVIGCKKLCMAAGLLHSQISSVRLAQAWTSAPGGPTHAVGTKVFNVSVSASTVFLMPSRTRLMWLGTVIT